MSELDTVLADLARLRASLAGSGLTPAEHFAVFGGFPGGASAAFPSFWTRKTRLGDEADHIIVHGVSVALPPGQPELAEAALNVTTCTHGAVPDGWDSPTVQMRASEITDDYRRMTDPERETLAELAATDTEIADDGVTSGGHPAYPDGSPWSYVPSVQRRTPTGSGRKADERVALLARKREELRRQLDALEGDS